MITRRIRRRIQLSSDAKAAELLAEKTERGWIDRDRRVAAENVSDALAAVREIRVGGKALKQREYAIQRLTQSALALSHYDDQEPRVEGR